MEEEESCTHCLPWAAFGIVGRKNILNNRVTNPSALSQKNLSIRCNTLEQ